MIQCKYCETTCDSSFTLKKHLQEKHIDITASIWLVFYKEVLKYEEGNISKIRKEKKKAMVLKKQKFETVANKLIKSKSKVVKKKKVDLKRKLR
jgi:hypothetical protein